MAGLDNPNPFNVQLPGTPEPELPNGVTVEIVADDSDDVSIDPATGKTIVRHADGSVTIDPEIEADEDADDDGHFANLAQKIGDAELQRIANDLIRKIEDDDQSRQQWLENYSKGMDLLGLELRKPSTDWGSAGGSISGTSKIWHPILTEACLRFQANARGELLPADGPVKVRDDGEHTAQSGVLAEALENDLNHYLTVTASEYYPDTDRLLFSVGFSGCGFKKVYWCPVRRRPVSESVDAKDIIVSNTATDLRSCGRITQVIMMRPATLKRMQILGVYRDVSMMPPASTSPENPVNVRIQQLQGTQAQTVAAVNAEDRDRKLYECYCELDILGFEHKENGEATGLPLPYKVTIDVDSRQVLEICRNYDPCDDLCLAKTVFVKYPFVPGMGFYDIGLLAILGNTALSATASWRQMLDAGSFSCFPGFLYLKALGHQLTNEFIIPPGGGKPIDAPVDDIRKAIMPLPYQPPNQAMMALVQDIVQTGQRVGGTPEMQVGEGRQDMPVGTTLAMIEQASKVTDAVHKRLHQAQGEEFRLLKKVFMDHPESIWQGNKKSCCLRLMMEQSGDQGIEQAQDQAEELARRKFVAALADIELIPQADPNTSSHVARIMRASTLVQLYQMFPSQMDAREVLQRALLAMDWGDVDKLAPPPQPQPGQPDPQTIAAQAQQTAAQSSVMMAQAKMLDSQTRAGKLALDSQRAGVQDRMKQDEITANQKIALLNLHKEMIIHKNDAMQNEQKRQDDLRSQHIDRLLQVHRNTFQKPQQD